tara:strand:+ start:43 stop:387 length:345 start_codon:yes stop_codon:yes gene_type:complete
MIKHITLLLLIGLAFWGCEDEVESPYIDVEWISFIPGIQYCVYTQEDRDDLIDVYGINGATGWVESEYPQCDTFDECIFVHYYKDEGYILYEKEASQEIQLDLTDCNNIQYKPK